MLGWFLLAAVGAAIASGAADSVDDYCNQRGLNYDDVYEKRYVNDDDDLDDRFVGWADD